MGSTLDKAIDVLNTPSVSLADGLRSLLLVATRMKSASLKKWVRNELHGYGLEDQLPSYREDLPVAIRMRFDGYGGRYATVDLRPYDIPEQLREAIENANFRQSVAEISSLIQDETAPGVKLPGWWVQQHRDLAQEGKAFSYEMMVLNHAHLLIPRTAVIGMLDSIRTFAIEMALGVEEVAPQAGDSGGPTVENDPRLAQSVNIAINHIYGDVITAQGESVDISHEADVQGAIRQSQLNSTEGQTISSMGDSNTVRQDSPEKSGQRPVDE